MNSCCNVSLRLALLFAALLIGVAAQSVAAEKPNIIVIVGDDMGYADIGVHGCKDIPTPNLDSLAAGGVRCSNGYVSGAYCSPTRAGLLTGRYQTRFGHEFNPGPAPGHKQKKNQPQQGGKGTKKGVGLPLSETTIANRLQDAGYATALIGKWHLGHAAPFHPLRRGFDEFFGFLGGSHTYFPGDGESIWRGNEPVEESAYLTDALGREAVAFLDRQSDKPFFLCLTFNAVHTPMQADDARLEKFKNISDKTRRTYAAMMSAMDDAIGAVLAKLREKKLDENTLVFFISDNGGPSLATTTVNASNNRPLRGSKRTTLEGGIRVPFLVKWPAQLPAGSVYDRPVIQLDILPTALAAAGIEVDSDSRIEGVNLLPHLNGENEKPPHDALFWRFGAQMAIRQGDWKLVKYDPKADGLDGNATEARLYNLAQDIGESKNLIDKEPEKAKALEAAWDEWNASNVPPLWGDGGKGKRRRPASNNGRPQRAAPPTEFQPVTKSPTAPA